MTIRGDRRTPREVAPLSWSVGRYAREREKVAQLVVMRDKDLAAYALSLRRLISSATSAARSSSSRW